MGNTINSRTPTVGSTGAVPSARTSAPTRSGTPFASDSYRAGSSGVRTSASDPLRAIDVPTGVAGHMGMTICPGKSSHSKSGYTWKRDLDQDFERLKTHAKADVIVPLIEDFEFDMLGVPDYMQKAAAHGLVVEHFPIKDVNIPKVAPTLPFVAKIKGYLESGKNVVIHCRGGNGRTGLIAACTLVALGKTPGQAIKMVRVNRPNAVETKAQEQFVYDFADALAAQS